MRSRDKEGCLLLLGRDKGSEDGRNRTVPLGGDLKNHYDHWDNGGLVITENIYDVDPREPQKTRMDYVFDLRTTHVHGYSPLSP